MSTQVEEIVEVAEKVDQQKDLILYNDDHHTFDFVIDVLWKCVNTMHYKPSSAPTWYIIPANARSSAVRTRRWRHFARHCTIEN